MSRPHDPTSYWNRREAPPSSAESRPRPEHVVQDISLRDDYDGTPDKPCWVLCTCGFMYTGTDSQQVFAAYAQHTGKDGSK